MVRAVDFTPISAFVHRRFIGRRHPRRCPPMKRSTAAALQIFTVLLGLGTLALLLIEPHFEGRNTQIGRASCRERVLHTV
jgi:hypothetical protein